MQRLTVSAVFHEYKIILECDKGITELRTVLGEIMNYLSARPRKILCNRQRMTV